MTQKALSDRNNKHIRETCIVTANVCVANTCRLPKVPPRLVYTKPNCDLVTLADQTLPHLHSGSASDTHKELRKNFNDLARQDVRLAHWINYKREFTPAMIAAYDIVRKSDAWGGKDIDKLAPEDRKIWNEAPWRAWVRTVDVMAKDVITWGVYDNFVELMEHAAVGGVLVTEFLTWWALCGAGHVSTLTYKERQKWADSSIFHGTALLTLGKMVRKLGMHELGYPLDWTNGPDAEPKLRVHQTSDKDMKVHEKRSKDILEEVHLEIRNEQKDGRNYSIQEPYPWVPVAYRGRRDD